MNPQEFREAGHRVVELLAEYLEHIEEKPVFPNVEPGTLSDLFAEALPQDGRSADEVLDDLERKLLPYCTNVGQPGYMGLITEKRRKAPPFRAGDIRRILRSQTNFACIRYVHAV